MLKADCIRRRRDTHDNSQPMTFDREGKRPNSGSINDTKAVLLAPFDINHRSGGFWSANVAPFTVDQTRVRNSVTLGE
jgi:hypothetical protein